MFRLILILLFALPSGLAAQSKEVRVLTYNIYEGLKGETDESKPKFVQLMRELNTDIAALQEVNGYTQPRLERLAAAYGHNYAVLLKPNGYPVALTSKSPIVGVERITDNMHHGFIVAQTGGYNIAVVHLSPFSYEKRLREVANILATIKSRGEQRRWIIMGDFNSNSPLDADGYADGRLLAHNLKSERCGDGKYRNLVDGQMDYATQRAMLDAGWVDALKVFHPEFVASYPSPMQAHGNPSPLYCRIDYAYVSADIRSKLRSAEILSNGAAAQMSDHLPLLITLKR